MGDSDCPVKYAYDRPVLNPSVHQLPVASNGPVVTQETRLPEIDCEINDIQYIGGLIYSGGLVYLQPIERGTD